MDACAGEMVRLCISKQIANEAALKVSAIVFVHVYEMNSNHGKMPDEGLIKLRQ
jgi:hypothetical protein